MKISDIETDALMEKWSKKYKRSIDCSNPKGFSQRAHCSARRARQAGKNTKSKSVNETKDHYKKFKYDVSYEIFGQDNLRPLYTGSHTVHANTPEEAIQISKSIVGGKNHKVTRAFLVNPILSSKELLELFMPMIDKMKYDPNNYSYLGRYGKFRIYAIKDKNQIEFFYKEPSGGILHHVKESKVISIPVEVNLTAWKTRDITKPSDVEEFSIDRESAIELISDLKNEGYTVKIHPVGTVYRNGKVVKGQLSEDSMSLRDWFGKGKHGGAGGGGWDRYNTKGERIGKCGERKPGEGKPKCLSKAKAASLRASGGKKAIAAAVNKKRREDPNPTKKGKAKMVSNKTRSDE